MEEKKELLEIYKLHAGLADSAAPQTVFICYSCQGYLCFFRGSYSFKMEYLLLP